ncbi:hypothetical protein ES705_33233 [subsurface metagenome]
MDRVAKKKEKIKVENSDLDCKIESILLCITEYYL